MAVVMTTAIITGITKVIAETAMAAAIRAVGVMTAVAARITAAVTEIAGITTEKTAINPCWAEIRQSMQRKQETEKKTVTTLTENTVGRIRTGMKIPEIHAAAATTAGIITGIITLIITIIRNGIKIKANSL